MRIIVFLSFLICVQSYPNWFHDYKEKHRKLYTVEQEKRAFSILEPKQAFAEKHGYKLNYRSDVNHTAKPNYFKHLRTKGRNVKETPRGNHRLGMPLTMDWRTHGAVTRVKKQGTCGACFSFSAVGSIEFWYWKKTRRLREFSIQQWIDCTRKHNYGCDGGLMEFVFRKATRTPASPAKYDPYKNREKKCKIRKTRPWLKVRSYIVQSDEWHYPVEQHLAHNLVQYGPIPIGIDSTNWHFEFYKGGILKASQCGKDIDHAVLLVGYTPKYWIIKNSWGTKWGLNGYIHIERGKNACGINSYASFITDAEV